MPPVNPSSDFPYGIWLWLKKRGTLNGALVSGNMDQNLRNPPCLILSHTHITGFRSYVWSRCPGPGEPVLRRGAGQPSLRSFGARLSWAKKGHDMPRSLDGIWLWLSKPMQSHSALGEFTTHSSLFLVGIGMFTGGTIWIWTHGYALSLVGLGMHLSFLDVLPFWNSSDLDPNWAMPLLRPGITEFEMLSPAAWLDFKQHIIRAAWLDFKQHIIRVQARGDRVAALRLWQSVGMVLHLPPGDGESAFEVPGLPPILLLPCTEEQCQRCRDRVGGFRFPWIGIWTQRHVLARGGESASIVWDRYHRHHDVLDLLGIEMARSRETWLRPRYGRWPRVAMWTSRCSWRRWQVGSAVWVDPVDALNLPLDAGQWPIGWGGIGMGRQSWAYLADLQGIGGDPSMFGLQGGFRV